jgi:hypothetical protein
MVRWKRPRKMRLEGPIIKQIAQLTNETKRLMDFIFADLHEKHVDSKTLIEEYEQKIMTRIYFLCKKAVKIPPSVSIIPLRFSIFLQNTSIKYKSILEKHMFYYIISHLQDQKHQSTRSMMQQILSKEEQKWWDNTGWCAIFAILRVAWHFDTTVRVMMKSNSDLAQLQELWKKDIRFSEKELRIWPAVSSNLTQEVLEYVYSLLCDRICLSSDFAQRASKITLSLETNGFKKLANFPSFYETVLVGPTKQY